MGGALIDKEFSAQKVRNLIHAADQIIFGSFPYDDARAALIRIREVFKSLLEDLKEIDDGANERIILQACRDANSNIFLYKKFLGFILRSSNVRNAFEAYAAIKEMAHRLLGDNIKIVISSEWNFSPFIYPLPSPILHDFILVGLPASESQNGLVLPLAGHELGHAVWRRRLNIEFSKQIEHELIRIITQRWAAIDRVFQTKVPASEVATNIVARAIWLKAYEYASRQIEETFCDAIGVWLFGTSYLHSFRYLIAPNPGVRRSEYYPAIDARAQYIVDAATAYGKEMPRGTYYIPTDYIKFFYETDNKKPARDQEILVSVADEVTRQFAPQIIRRVHEYCANERLIEHLDDQKADTILGRLINLAPADGINNVGNIANAVWKLRLDISKLDLKSADDEKRLYVLNDLLFKTLEVNEFRTLEKRYASRK